LDRWLEYCQLSVKGQASGFGWKSDQLLARCGHCRATHYLDAWRWEASYSWGEAESDAARSMQYPNPGDWVDMIFPPVGECLVFLDANPLADPAEALRYRVAHWQAGDHPLRKRSSSPELADQSNVAAILGLIANLCPADTVGCLLRAEALQTSGRFEEALGILQGMHTDGLEESVLAWKQCELGLVNQLDTVVWRVQWPKGMI
jgi:hypothetical protein